MSDSVNTAPTAILSGALLSHLTSIAEFTAQLHAAAAEDDDSSTQDDDSDSELDPNDVIKDVQRDLVAQLKSLHADLTKYLTFIRSKEDAKLAKVVTKVAKTVGETFFDRTGESATAVIKELNAQNRIMKAELKFVRYQLELFDQMAKRYLDAFNVQQEPTSNTLGNFQSVLTKVVNTPHTPTFKTKRGLPTRRTK